MAILCARKISKVVISILMCMGIFFSLACDASPHMHNYYNFTASNADTFMDKNFAKESQYWMKRNKLHNGFMIKNNNDLVDIFHGTCYEYVSKPAVCSHIYFKVKNTKSFDVLATTYYHVGDNYSTVDGILIDDSLRYLSVKDIRWIAYHELSHVEFYSVIKNRANQDKAEARGRKVFESNVPLEVLADCMVVAKAGLSYEKLNLPYYFTTVKNYQMKDMHDVCARWHYVLYGK